METQAVCNSTVLLEVASGKFVFFNIQLWGKISLHFKVTIRKYNTNLACGFYGCET
jgi:hypothetical protein